MSNGYVLDAGVLQGLAKETAPNTPLADRLRGEKVRLVTIREVMAECIDVPFTVLDALGILVEPTRTPPGPPTLLDAFSSSPRPVPWSVEPLGRADRAVVGHAIAGHCDVLTTDATMRERSYREFLTRLERLPETGLPSWYLPNIEVVRRGLWH